MKYFLVLLLTGCHPGAPVVPATGDCSYSQHAAIAAAYSQELSEACSAYDDFEKCPQYPAIRDRWLKRREEWVLCSQH